MSWVFVECCVFVLAVLLCWCLPSTRYCLLRQKFFLWTLLSSVSVIVLLCWSLRSCLFAVVSHCDSFCFVLVMSSLSWVVNNRFSLKVLVSASRAPSALAGLCLPVRVWCLRVSASCVFVCGVCVCVCVQGWASLAWALHEWLQCERGVGRRDFLVGENAALVPRCCVLESGEFMSDSTCGASQVPAVRPVLC